MSRLKDALAASSFYASPVHKLAYMPEVIAVANISNMSRKPLQAVLTLLLLISTSDTSFPVILQDVLSSSIAGIAQKGPSPLIGGIVQAGRSTGGARGAGVNHGVVAGGGRPAQGHNAGGADGERANRGTVARTDGGHEGDGGAPGANIGGGSRNVGQG